MNDEPTPATDLPPDGGILDDGPPEDDAPPPDDDDAPVEPQGEVDVPFGNEEVLAPGVRQLADAMDASPAPPRTLADRPTFGRATASRPPAQTQRPLGPVPPADLQAERAVLGSVLIEPDSIAYGLGTVRPDDFYDTRHRLIWAAMSEMAGRSERIDPITVHSQLRTLDVEQKSGGLPYLIELAGTTGSSVSMEHYAQTVARLATVRRVLSATHKVQNEGYQLSVDPDAFVELVQTEVVGALDQLIGGPKVEIADIVKEVYDGILARRSQEGDTVGMPTGFRDLDRILLGFHPTDLLILAARPAMGKTALALNLALNVAFKKHARGERKGEHFGVMIFSLEMGREQLVMRLLSQRSRVGLTKLRKGDIDNEEEVFLREAAGDLHDLSLYIDDTPALSAIDLRARAKRVHMKYGLDLIVIDYLQLMRGSGGGRQSRENEISEISRALKGLAKELNVTVLALSQLNRGVEGRADKRPLMSDLRESGAIEQDADVIMFIYRDHVYNPETASEADAELNISKHRAGAIGKVELHFAGHLTRFTNRDDRYNDQYTGVRPDFG